MRKVCFSIVCAAIIGLTSSAFAAECTRGEAPSVPNGETASRDEMISANKAIKEYVATTNTYIDCVDAAETAAVAKAKADMPADKPDVAKLNAIHAQYVTLHNSAVDAIQGVADQFNAAVRAYKAKAAAAAPAKTDAK